MSEDAVKCELIRVKMMGMTQSEIGHANKKMMMFQSMKEIAIDVSLIANELQTIMRNCKKLGCQVQDLLTPSKKWIKELQEKKEYHLHKSTRKTRLSKVKSARSNSFRTCQFDRKATHAFSLIQEDENGG